MMRTSLFRLTPLLALALLLGALLTLPAAPVQAQGTPTITVSAPARVTEGQSIAITFTVSAATSSTASATDRQFTYSVTLGTAESADIGNFTGTGTNTIPAGGTTRTVNFPNLQDTDLEDETFTVTLVGAPTGYSIGSPSAVTITIIDDDKPTSLDVSPGNAKLDLSWTAPTGVTLTGYDVHYTSAVAGTVGDNVAVQTGNTATAATGWLAVTRSGTTASQTISSLNNGTTYRVRVRAKDSGGSGAWVFGTGTPAAATNADLSGLTASTSTSASGTFSALTLSPSPFAAATTAYTASVANARTHVKITPTTNDSTATVEVGKGASLTSVTSGSASAAIPLSVNANAITVKVTAQDGTTTKTYTVTVTRQPSTDADLSGLTVSAVAQGTFPPLTLDPETFAAATTEYTATVANTVAAVRVTPTTSDSNATVEVGLEGQSLTTVPSGQANDDFISLSVGANAITVKVTAQDGSTTKTYKVTVTREEAQLNPAPTGLTVRRGDGRLDLSWNPPPASVGTLGNYEVEYTSSATVSNADVADTANNDPAAGWVVGLSLNANSVTPSHPITGLTSGTVYRVRVRYHLSDFTPSYWAYATGTPVGPDVSKWNPTVFVQELGGDRYGCRSGVKVSAMPGRSGGAECSELANFDGNEFSVSHVRFGTRGYRVLDLYIEPHRSTSWGETAYRVVFRVDDDSGTAELGRGMTLVLTTPGVTEKRLPFNAAERDGNTFRWPLLFDDGGLGWDQGWVRGVKVRIHQFTAGLDYVRVHYDEMRGGQSVNGFGAWLPARVSAYFPDGLVAYIPGQFPSSDPEQGMLTTTHAKLWVGASHSASTLEWAGGNVHGVTGNFAALDSGGFTPAIELDPASKWTYVYIRVTNGSQVATHTIAIDPPPRTYTLSPQISVTEGEEATLTLSLGSPAGAGGVSFTVAADYPEGGATAEDVGQFAATLTVPEGRQSARIVIPTVNDEAIEEDEERFTVRVAHVGEPAWAVDPSGTASAVVTIEDNDEPPEGPEPWDIKVVPGDGTLTVTWNVGSREGVDDSEIWHVLRWSQEFGVWNNPRDRRAVGRNDGLSVDPGLTSYTITGLKNGVATGVFIRSMVGHRNNMSERDGNSSKWVRTKGEHTTPVAPPNAAPTVAAAIADATIINESGTHGVSLSGVFSDADGDALTVTAASSDTPVATVSVSADYSTLTVSAQARGTATVTVTGDDGKGGSVEAGFTVKVRAAPVVASAIGDITELEAEDRRTISMSGVFSDPDGDAVTVTQASSSDTSIAAVSAAIDGATSAITAVTVTAKSEGTATITVTARDADGNTVSDAFDVTVNAPAAQQQKVNNPPTVSAAIADATIVSESGTRQVSLSGVFGDADGDSLTTTASSSDENTATVAVAADHSTLTVTAKARGTATITVTAEDGYGGSVEDSFTVRVKAAPVVASAIADVSSLEAGATRELSLAGVFSDPDGDSLSVTAASSDEGKATVSVAADRSTLTVSGVSEGTATITVTAQDSDGNRVSDAFDVTIVKAPEPEPEPVELPGPVLGLELTATHDSVSASWSAPESGDAPDGYIVNIKRQGGGAGETRRPGAGKTSLTFRDLNGGSTYEVWVRAENEAGKGERVKASVTLPSVLPGPVTGLEVVATGDGVTVSWSAPETGGAPDGYIVHIRPEGGAEGSGRTKTPRAKRTSVTFENLEAGRTYQVWVRAENEAGKGVRVHASITLPEPEQQDPGDQGEQGDEQQDGQSGQ